MIAAVGKPRDRHLAAAIDEYETRAARYWPLDVVEVREASGRGVAADDARLREGERLQERVPAGALVVVCDERGDQLTSAQFAALVNGARESARDLAFMPVVDVIQLAPFTLPHELARLVLAEQLYRAGTIVRGEPYHK